MTKRKVRLANIAKATVLLEGDLLTLRKTIFGIRPHFASLYYLVRLALKAKP